MFLCKFNINRYCKNVIWELNAEHTLHKMVYFYVYGVTKSLFTAIEIFGYFKAQPKFSNMHERKYF